MNTNTAVWFTSLCNWSERNV